MHLTRQWIWLLLPGVLAISVCTECRPLELQRSPGIGIELTMGYGIVAVTYKNGTTVDVGKIPGSTQYRAAMRALAEDARIIELGEESSLPKVNLPSHVRVISLKSVLLEPITLFSFSELPKYVRQQAQKHAPSLFPPRPPYIETDSIVPALTSMLSDLKGAANEIHPLKYPYIMLSVPDFEAYSHHAHLEHFHSAVEQAGLKLLHGVGRAYHDALRYHGIEDCSDEIDHFDLECVLAKDRVDVVLVVRYEGASLGMTLLTRWIEGDGYRLWGMFWPARLSESLELGAMSMLRKEDEEGYWKKVKDAVEVVVGSDVVEKTLFFGESGPDGELRRVVRGVLDKMAKAKAKADDRGTNFIDEVGPADDCLYGVARGASVSAREGMMTGFVACLVPDHCAKLESGDPEFGQRKEKHEL